MLDIPYLSIPDMLRKNALQFRERPALKYRKNGLFVSLTYGEFYDQALMVARGLLKAQVQAGDRIAILSENRADWVIADMGILCAGGVTVPIYPTNTPEQVAYALNHSEARAVFISSKHQYAKLLKIRETIPAIKLVVSFEEFPGEPALPVCTMSQFMEIDLPLSANEKKQFEALIDSITPDALLTIIYTSGTTGVPKGAMLTNRNVLFDAYNTSKKAEIVCETDVFLSFLPLSHVFERTIGYYLAIMSGALLAFADSIEKVPENMAEVKPTVMVSVPRLFEKIHARILDNVHKMPPLKQKIFHWAIKVGRQYVETRYIKQANSLLQSFKYGVARRLVFDKLRDRFGGRLKFFCCGGAPLDKSINEFFWIIGFPILEGYGLTETSPVICFNNFKQVRFGSVGTAIENTEIKVEADGELLIKGPQVMTGYYKNPVATSEAIQDGWFRTGDIGQIENGFVFITDRKKELIITSGGKNIAPRRIEGEFQLDHYITQGLVYGDRKPYLTALLVPNMEKVVEYAQENNLSCSDRDALVASEPIRKLFEQRIAEINTRLAAYETVKKFVLLPRDFSIEEGEMTPTMKLKRKVICEHYKDKIEEMYADNKNCS